MQPENTMVKISFDSGYVSVQTVTRKHGISIRFLIDPELIRRVINDPLGSRCFDSDVGNYAEFWVNGDNVWFKFIWLNSYGDDSVKGYSQQICVPVSRLDELIEIHTPFQILCKKASGQARIINTAHRTVSRIVPDKKKRRALSKAMRDSFCWPGETVTLWNDGGDDFYFTTESGFPKNGGLILHKATRNGHPCLYYSVHT